MLDNECFIKLNKKLIEQEPFDDKMLLIVAYIGLYRNAKGFVNVSIDNLSYQFGYKLNRHEGRINKDIRDRLEWLETNNYIFISGDITKLKNYETFTIEINGDHNIYNPESPYVELYFEEFHMILKSDTGHYKGRLLKVYTHIKKRINLNKDEGLRRYGITINQISNDCGFTRGTNIQTILNMLKELKMIYIHYCGSYESEIAGKIKPRNVRNYYAIEPGQFDGVEEEVLEYLRSVGIDIDHFNKKVGRKPKPKKDTEENTTVTVEDDKILNEENISENQDKINTVLDDIADHISGSGWPSVWGEPPPQFNEPTQEKLEEQYYNDLIESVSDDPDDEEDINDIVSSF